MPTLMPDREPLTARSVRLIDGEMAAAAVGVSPAAIRKWVFRGYLTAAGRDGRRALYALEDVYRADADRRVRTVQRRSW